MNARLESCLSWSPAEFTWQPFKSRADPSLIPQAAAAALNSTFGMLVERDSLNLFQFIAEQLESNPSEVAASASALAARSTCVGQFVASRRTRRGQIRELKPNQIIGFCLRLEPQPEQTFQETFALHLRLYNMQMSSR